MRQRGMCRGILGVLLVLGFGSWMGWHLWPCVFAELTGLPCPGCGITRATVALVQGDWRTSWAFHPFAGFFVLAGMLVAAGGLLPYSLAEGLATKVEVFEQRTKLPAIILVAVVCFGLLRMLGFWYQPPIGDFSARFSKRAEASPTVQPR